MALHVPPPAYYRVLAVDYLLRDLSAQTFGVGVICGPEGENYDIETIAYIIDLPVGDVQTAIDQLIAAGIIEIDERGYMFYPDVKLLYSEQTDNHAVLWFAVTLDFTSKPEYNELKFRLSRDEYYCTVAIDFRLRDLASWNKGAGVIAGPGGDQLKPEAIARIIKLPIEDVQASIKALQDVGIIKIDAQGRFYFPDVKRHASAERTRKCRAKAKEAASKGSTYGTSETTSEQ